VLGHSNITEIDLALDLLWRTDIPRSKIVLGTGFYGRTFALEDSSCTEPGCPFSGPGANSPCTGTAGFLSYKGKYSFLTLGCIAETLSSINGGGPVLMVVRNAEVRDILRSNKAKAKFDKKAAVKCLTYGQHSWNNMKSGSSSSSSALSKRDEGEIAQMDMSSVTSWIS
jgi:chitinase